MLCFAVVIITPTAMVKGSSYLLSQSFPQAWPSSQGTTGGAHHRIVMLLFYTNYQISTGFEAITMLKVKDVR